MPALTEIAHVQCVELALGADGAPPTEFRLFKAGWNETDKGPFFLDAQALADTIAAYEKSGVDLKIDLEHDTFNKDAVAHRSDAKDARGWCQLAARDGELWAVNVSWTPDGARRLAEKTQRYTSPVAGRDPQTKRIMFVRNIALVSEPATHCAQPLVAASKGPGCARGPVCDTLLAALTRRLTRR